jgi:2,3,4,5-tetrahydropyridine-2-carboxylate N-succinyltransferase
MSTYLSIAFGIGSKNKNGDWLEVFYPAPLFQPSEDFTKSLKLKGGNEVIELSNSESETLSKSIQTVDSKQAAILSSLYQGDNKNNNQIILCALENDIASTSTPEVYLKLHLLSHRLVKPHGCDLSGIFPLLPNVAWTNYGAIDLSELTEKQIEARHRGEVLEVKSIDKFPKMTDYVVPSGVRLAHTARVRLGAYLGEGTTVMHEGFINFNAGCEGPNMIEGRISAGVFVGSGSDLGGGCSTMGTLSGGNDTVISIGKDCLLGANSGLGIPLGDRCTIEAGLYVTGGSKVEVLDDSGKLVETIKAGQLAGKNDLLFIRNSITGAIQCRTNKSAIALNDELHSHN